MREEIHIYILKFGENESESVISQGTRVFHHRQMASLPLHIMGVVLI